MFWKALAFVFLFGLGWMTYSFIQFRSVLHDVYVTPDDYVVTAPADADLTVVEFVDYGCPYSKKMHPILKEAVEKDGKVRYIPRPLLSKTDPMGRQVLLFLYASARQGGLPEMHEKIFELWPITDMNVLMDYAKSIGIDTLQLEEDMKLVTTQEAVDLNQKYYEQWKFQATPTVLIATKAMGTKAIYVPTSEAKVEEFLEHFKQARQWY